MSVGVVGDVRVAGLRGLLCCRYLCARLPAVRLNLLSATCLIQCAGHPEGERTLPGTAARAEAGGATRVPSGALLSCPRFPPCSLLLEVVLVCAPGCAGRCAAYATTGAHTCDQRHCIHSPAAQDTSLLPAVHRRVRLAVRLDELERKASKAKAEKSWRQVHAEQLGIDLSDESGELFSSCFPILCDSLSVVYESASCMRSSWASTCLMSQVNQQLLLRGASQWRL